jgi:transposase
MLREIDMIDIKILYKQGYSLKNICRETGFSINTVRKYITKNAVPSYKKREKTTSKLDNYKSYINVRVNQAKPNWIPATVIFDEIKKQGYLGKISLLRNYMYNIKPRVVERPLIRFETQPG